MSKLSCLVFDAYGTLFDVHSAANQLRELLGTNYSSISSVWRQKQLEYTWLRSLMGLYDDFDKVTMEALHYALKVHGTEDTTCIPPLLEAYKRLSCYQDVSPCLEKLKGKGIHTAILTNGTEASVKELVEHANIQQLMDDIISVSAVRIYKPHPSVYDLVLRQVGVTKEQVGFVSSNCWDAIGASNFGFRVFWLNRYNVVPDSLPAKYEVISDLSQLADMFSI
eukprot:jgi/Galph1/356/GphlegSOOS_G5080.1